MGGNKGVLIAVVVVAAVVWILFNKSASTVANVNRNIKQTYTTGTTVNAVATSLAPALGTFLQNLQRSPAPSYTTGAPYSSSSNIDYSALQATSAYSSDVPDSNIDYGALQATA